MSNSTNVVYTKIGQNRGTLRFWIEGRRVARSGINPGDRFDVDTEGQKLVLVFKDNGSNQVSRRKRGEDVLPLIEVKGEQLRAAFKEDDRVRVVVKEDRLEVTLHHSVRRKANREHRLLSKIRSGEPLQIGSICHGGGILDHAVHTGLSRAGISTELAFANEIEEGYIEHSMARNPVWGASTMGINAPMQDVEWQFVPKVDVLLAGLPCTGASLSGRAKNSLKFAEAHETAGSLFISFLNAIQILSPSVVILENVPPYQNTISMHVIRSVLSEMEYTMSEAVLSGRDFGALENRQRMCMVATSSGVPSLNVSSVTPLGAPQHTLGAVLEDIAVDDPMWKDYAYLMEKEKRDIEAGKGFRRQIVTPDSSEVGTIGRGYAKARSTEPFVAHPSGDGRSRLLTVAEHAAVKCIPKSLLEGASFTMGHQIAGQSIIHSVFEEVSRWLGMSFQSERPALAA